MIGLEVGVLGRSPRLDSPPGGGLPPTPLRVPYRVRALLRGDPASAPTSLMLRVYGTLYLIGATLCLVWLALADRRGVNALGILACIAAAYVVSGVALVLLPRFAWTWLIDLLVAVATLLISLVIVFDHSSGSPLSWYYVWATAYAFWFFSLHRALWQVLVCAAGYCAALVWLGGPVGVGAGRMAMMVTTLVVVGFLIRVLALRLKHSTERFQVGFERARIGMCLTDQTGRFVETNRAMRDMLGRDGQELYTMTLLDVTAPDDIELGRATTDATLTLPGGSQLEYRLVRPDGALLWAQVTSAPLEQDGEMLVFSQVLDVTARIVGEQERRLRSREQAAVAELGRRALEGAPIADLALDALSRVGSTLGFARVDLVDAGRVQGRLVIASRWGTLTSLSQSPAGDSHVAMVLSSAEPVAVDNYEADYRFGAAPAGAEGMRSGVGVVVRLTQGLFGVLIGYCDQPRSFGDADVNFMRGIANVLGAAMARRQAEDRSRHDSLHDSLTGLANRALFHDRLEQALARSARSHTAVAVLFVDVDSFKDVNDSLGHQAGDSLLVAVAGRLGGAVRPSDTIARYGGDEFIVLCEDIDDPTNAVSAADRVATAVAGPFRVHATTLSVTVSIGVVVSDLQRATPDSLLRDADAAMYAAKRAGGNRVEVYDPMMRRRLVDRAHVRQALMAATERDEFFLAYQPIVSLPEGRITAIEALVRWRHPTRGLLSPDQFIPIAEESGLIVPVGAWILNEACSHAALWNATIRPGTRIPVNVNVSARQLSDAGFAGMVADALDRTGLATRDLALEITENTLIEQSDVLSVITDLHASGVRFVLDDFGTGYSSLSHIAAFPLDGFKIDRSFTARLDDQPHIPGIIRALLTLGQQLDLHVVAEGVETAEHEQRLITLGCCEAQGYLYAKPLPLDSTLGMLEHAFGDGASPSVSDGDAA